jgi:hypothetical protein
MEIALIVLLLLIQIIALTLLIATYRRSKLAPESKEIRGNEIAKIAWSHAHSIGGDEKEMKRCAFDAFRLIDARDGKRDYTDRQIAILLSAKN